MSEQKTVSYEVWAQRGESKDPRHGAQASKEAALATAKFFNDEEAENARLEFRPVRTRFFVVEAVTTRKEVS